MPAEWSGVRWAVWVEVGATDGLYVGRGLHKNALKTFEKLDSFM